MGATSLVGAATVTILGRVLHDFAEKDYVKIDFPNGIMEVKVGPNGNAVYAPNAQGSIGDFPLRLMRGSPDDIFFAAALQAQQLNPTAVVLLAGSYVLPVGDGSGNIINDTYNLYGGIFRKPVPALSTAEGNLDTGVAMYDIRFAYAVRAVL